MTTIVLKEEILEKIKSDKILRAKVAEALGYHITSMPKLLYGNDKKLTQAVVLKVLREYLGVRNDRKLLSEIQISVVA